MTDHPSDAGFRQLGEWAPHRACWLAWPHQRDLWPDLAAAQSSFVALCRAVARPLPGLEGEALEVLVQSAAARSEAQRALAGLPVTLHEVPFGDIWMRDTAPVFLADAAGEVASVRFRFNGWGEKYVYPGDELVAERVQRLVGGRAFESALVCEGGAVESDGAGLCLSTRAVLLNDNRNRGLAEAEACELLAAALGASRVLLLDDGLLNDHTDGHIDNIARFIAPGRVVCMCESGTDDPNRAVLARIEQALAGFGLEVTTVPSPGLVRGRDGDALPASYLNFYIANRSVAVPTFDSPHDSAALSAIAALFPDRVVRGVPARVFLEEGGTLHCISQHEPLAGSEREEP